MTTGRDVAEKALAGLGSGASLTWPAVAERIRQARVNRGLTELQVAGQIGVTIGTYRDLEARDEEAFTVLALAELARLGHSFDVSIRTLLLGDEGTEPGSRVSFADVAVRLRESVATSGLTVDELGKRVGWDVTGVLSSPEALWDFNVVGLRDVCTAVGVDWASALPDQQVQCPGIKGPDM